MAKIARKAFKIATFVPRTGLKALGIIGGKPSAVDEGLDTAALAAQQAARSSEEQLRADLLAEAQNRRAGRRRGRTLLSFSQNKVLGAG